MAIASFGLSDLDSENDLIATAQKYSGAIRKRMLDVRTKLQFSHPLSCRLRLDNKIPLEKLIYVRFLYTPPQNELDDEDW